MSDIEFACPQCGQHLAVDATGAGMTVACPQCGQAIIVPQLARLAGQVPSGRTKRWWWLSAGIAAALMLIAGLLVWQTHRQQTTAASSASVPLAEHSASREAAGNPQAAKKSNLPAVQTTPVKNADTLLLPSSTPTLTQAHLPASTPTMLTATPTGLPEPVPVRSDYVVGAYYWISWDAHNVLTHFMDWRDSMFQPIIGQYNSTDTAVIDQHIKWAVEHGISFFAVQFYETQLKKGFLKASFLPYIKFSFIAPMELSASENPEHIVHQIEWMSPYFDNPQYLKINGRPVIFILIRYAGDRLTLQEESLLLTRIKDTKSFARKIGQNPYLVGVYSIGDGRFDRTSRKISQEFDTITIYNMPAAGGNSTSYDFMVSAYKSRTKDWSEEVKAANISFIPNVIPGFDDSLSYRHGTRGWLITRSGSTPKKFQMMCEAIKQYINPNNNMLMITAWNEFAEGSVIEPTKEYGFSYLEVIKQTFTTTPKELYKQALFTQSVVRSFVPIRGKNPFRIGGFTLQGLDAAGFNHPETFDSLDRLIKTGANSVTISPQVFMKTGDSSSIEGLNTRPSHQLADIGKVVEYLRNAGISVAIKPDLLPSDGTWSGRIHPTNAGIFFQNYKQIMLGYAALAKDKGVDTLYLSNEMKSMVVDPRYTGYWTDIIQSIRKVFPGKISLNSTIDDGNGLSGSEVMNIPFADRLDFIGVSLYIPLTNKGDPTVEDLVKAWYRNRDGVDIIESLKNINKRYGKPVMISEIAYRSIRGANTRPSDMNGKGVVDFQEQANLFEALMRVLTKERGDWLMGVSIWAWFTDLDPSAELPAKGYTILFGEQGSTIQNKPAEKLLTDWFLGVRQAAN